MALKQNKNYKIIEVRTKNVLRTLVDGTTSIVTQMFGYNLSLPYLKVTYLKNSLIKMVQTQDMIAGFLGLSVSYVCCNNCDHYLPHNSYYVKISSDHCPIQKPKQSDY
jgi:hypothetical protein